MHRLVADRRVGLALVALAALGFGAFGIAGVGRQPPINADMQFLYVAGRLWLHGKSPYPLSDFVGLANSIPGLWYHHLRYGFAYPPTIAPLCLLLGALPFSAASVGITVANLLAALVTAYFCLALARASVAPGDSSTDAALRWFVPAVILGNPFTAHIVWSGQTTLLATAALATAWYYTQVENRPIVAGVLFAVCTLKPQVGLLAILWIVFQRRWRVLAIMAAACVVLMAVPALASGPIGMLQEWLAALRSYEAGPIQSAGFQNVFGIQSLLVAAGIRAPRLTLVAVAALALMWMLRERLAADESLGLLVSFSCLFLYAHDYDLAAAAPLYASVWRRASTRATAAAGALAFYVLMFAPQRFLRGEVSAVWLHWRELVLLVAVVWLPASQAWAGRRRPAPLLTDSGLPRS